MKLDVILPAYNKEKIISNCYEKIKEEFKDIKLQFILVDNSSSDNTLNVFKTIQKDDEDNIKVISLSKHTKDYLCILAGMNYCNGEYICVYDLDLNINISYIKKMIAYIKEHKECDSMCMCRKTIKESFIKRITRNIINNYIGYNNIKGKTNYRVFTKKMINSIVEISKNNKIHSYTFDNIGFTTNYEKIKSNDEIKEKIVIPNSMKPIIACQLFGILCLISSILILIIKIIFSKLSIAYFLSFLLLLLSGIILTLIGILSKKIVSSIFISEPNYIIKEKIGFDEDML